MRYKPLLQCVVFFPLSLFISNFSLASDGKKPSFAELKKAIKTHFSTKASISPEAVLRFHQEPFKSAEIADVLEIINKMETKPIGFDFVNRSFDNKSVGLIADFIETAKSTEILYLSKFNSYAMPQFINALRSNKTLKHVFFRENKLNDAFAEKLAYVIEGSQIEVLDVSSNNLSPKGIEFILSAAKKSKHLKELSITKEINFTDALVEMLAEVIEGSQIEVLDVSNDNLSPKGIEFILSAAEKSKHLKNLDVKENHINSKTLKLVDSIKNTNLQVVTFSQEEREKIEGKKQLIKENKRQKDDYTHLHSKGFSPDDIRYLLFAHSEMPDEELPGGLNLGNNSSMGKEGIGLIAEYLELNPKITSLRLFHNNFSAKAISLLAKSLRQNNKLEQLYLHGNRFGDEGAKHIANMIETSNLTALHISETDLGDEGIGKICDAIKRGTKLTDLCISKNEIDENAAHKLADTLKSSNLKVILLANVTKDEKVLKIILDALKNSENVVEVDLSTNSITEKFFGDISEILKSSPIKSLLLSKNGLGNKDSKQKEQRKETLKSWLENTRLTYLNLAKTGLSCEEIKAIISGCKVITAPLTIDISKLSLDEEVEKLRKEADDVSKAYNVPKLNLIIDPSKEEVLRKTQMSIF